MDTYTPNHRIIALEGTFVEASHCSITVTPNILKDQCHDLGTLQCTVEDSGEEEVQAISTDEEPLVP